MKLITWADEIVPLTTILSTSLNSLANNTTDVSGNIDNSETETIQHATYMDLFLTLASVNLSAQTNPAIEVYFLESLDLTNFHQGDDATSNSALYPAKSPNAILPVRTGTGAEVKYSVVTRIPIFPGYFKICLINKTGAAFPASGNILQYRTYSLKQGI